MNAWGVLLVLGVVIPGLLLPLVAAWQPRRLSLHTTTTAILVLIGGFLLRVVVVLSSEAV